ncbi:MAG: hypothetical protein U9R75_07315, partial [Candidatus Thermoplasmatota archaeon]|nr:hypothetical protein [Candidatus Thermoplasmatota archaeon]
GDGRNYWGKASTSDLGNDPAGVLPPKEIVMGSVAGETYKVLFQLPKAAPSINNIEQDPPVADPDSLILDIEFEVEGNILRGSSPVASGRFDLANTSGNMDLFITDQVGLQAYRAGAPFNSYSMLDRASGANISMNITGPGEWGIVFSNGFSQWTSKIVNYTITISGLYGIRIDSPEEDAGVMMDDRCEISGIYFCPGSDPIYTLEVRIGDEGRWMDVEKNMITHEGEREVRYFEHDWNIDLDGPGDVTIWVRLITEETEFLVHRRVYVEDLEPPRITVSQKDPMTRKGADLRLSGSVSDNHHVSSMSCSLYDAVYDIELLEGSWEVSVPTAHLDIGEQLIHIHARDPSGNIGVVEVRFDVLDNDPPEIDIYYPDRGSLFRKGETIRISGKIFERTEVEKLFVSIGDPRNIDIRDHLLDDGTFTYVLSTNLGSIEDGRNIIKVTAVDDGGNIGYGEVEVILDATAPLIDLREIPEEIVIRAGSDLEIMFPITDEIGVSEVLFSFNSGEFNDVTRYLDGDIFEMKIGRELDIGWNTITVRASDEAGSMSEESIECYVDDQSPDIRFTSIPEYVLIGEPLLIGIEIIEDDMISSLEVRSDGNSRYFGELYSGPLPVELDTGTSRGGVRKIDLIFSDRAGHLEERTIEVNFIREDTDSDEDGIPDLWEYSHDMDPLRFDSDDDPDGDGFSNLEEYLGDDGEPGNDDSTDPRSSGSYPSREIENTNNWAFIMFAIIGIILVGLIAYFIVSKRK